MARRPELTPEQRGFAKAYKQLHRRAGPTEIAKAMRRQFRPKNFDKSSISRLLSGITFKKIRKAGGRSRHTSKKDDRKLVSTLRRLQKTEDGEVTAEMVREHAGVTAKDGSQLSTGLISSRFREAGMPWSSVRYRLEVTDEEAADAVTFARKWIRKPKAYFENDVIFQDNKRWKLCTSPESRRHARRQETRGMYRERSGGYDSTKPHPRKHRRGADGKNVEVCAGFGDGQCFYAEVVAEDRNWCAAEYEDIVTTELASAVWSRPPAHPRLSPYTLWRDRDPNGYHTGRGRAAERNAGITVEPLPPKRPLLMPLDYSFHTEIRRTLRKQEKEFPPDFHESRAAFIRRLLHVYMYSISAEQIRKTCGDMKRRLRAVIDAKGEHCKVN